MKKQVDKHKNVEKEDKLGNEERSRQIQQRINKQTKLTMLKQVHKYKNDETCRQT